MTIINPNLHAPVLDAASGTKNQAPAVRQFLEFMESANKGLGAFIRATILASKGLNEKSFAQLPPEDQEKINCEILEEIKKGAAKEIAERLVRQGAV